MQFDWLPMSDRLHAAMTEHLLSSSGPWVFPDPQTGEPYIARQHWLGRLCRRAGVKEFGLHGIHLDPGPRSPCSTCRPSSVIPI